MNKPLDLLYIVIPAYNEEGSIEKVVQDWVAVVNQLGHSHRLLIINDGSKDNTLLKLQNLEKQHPQLIVINKTNSGHGPTCTFGYQKAIEAGATYVFQTDSDGQTSADEFWKFWENREQYDFIIGHRVGRQDGYNRKFVSNVLKTLIFFIFGTWIKDPNTPFRLMKADILKKYLSYIRTTDRIPNVLMSILVTYFHHKILWFPIHFASRKTGTNSINFVKIAKIGFNEIKTFLTLKKRLS